MDTPNPNAPGETCAITSSVINLRHKINGARPTNKWLFQALWLLRVDLEVLTNMLDEEDGRRMKPFVTGAEKVIENHEHINFHKLVDEYLLELQSCLITLQEILKRKKEEKMSHYEPNERAIEA